MELLWYQFGLQIGHFAITLFASLVSFAVCWLYFDAWLIRKEKREVILTVGFLLVSISFLFSAASIEQGILIHSTTIRHTFIQGIRVTGYFFIFWGILTTKILPRPREKEAFIGVGFWSLFPIVPVILTLAIALLYRRLATKGLEHHLAPIARGFFVLAAYEAFSLTSFWQTTSIVWVRELIKPFGYLWMVEHVLLLIASIIFLSWVWSYLLKRFETQLFFVFTTSSSLIFFVVTMVFSSLFVASMQRIFISQSETDGKLLLFYVSQLEKTVISETQKLAKEQQIKESLMTQKKLSSATLQELKTRFSIFESFGLLNNQGITIVQSANAANILPEDVRAQIKEKQSVSTVITENFGSSTRLSIIGIVRIDDDAEHTGFVWTKAPLDTAFLDGIKETTGLDSSLYSGNVLSATTLSQGGTVPLTGLTLNNEKIMNTVLVQGKPYTGLVTLAQQTYYGTFRPIIAATESPVGMLFIGQGAAQAFITIGKTISFVFHAVVILVILSIIPAILLARVLARQVR